VLSVERTKAVASQVPSEVRILDRAQAPRYPGLKGTPLIVFVILAGAGAAVVAAAGVIYRA
jgi:uncharacterized protein involved in exopolysaccharide biosynthesis